MIIRYPKNWLALGLVLIAVLVGAAYLVFSNSKNPQPNQTTNEPQVGSPISGNSATYFNRDAGIRFDYPKNLQVWEIPTEELINSDLYYFGNQRPDFTVEVGAKSDRKDSAAETKEGSYLIALYKRRIDPKSLLGNYAKFTSAKINIAKPEVLTQDIEKISGVDYQKLESFVGGTDNVSAYELSANLINGWTVYSVGVSKPVNKAKVDNTLIRSTLVNILGSLDINRGIHFNTLDWKACRSKDSQIELLIPPTMDCSPFNSPGEVVFDIYGTYSSGNTGSLLLKKNRFNYRIGLTKDDKFINNFLDTKYSCYEGSCPNYPIGLSEIKIGDTLFRVSQSDSPVGEKYPSLSERTVKMLGTTDGWNVYSTQVGIIYKLGMTLPIKTDFSQLISQEIINSIVIRK